MLTKGLQQKIQYYQHQCLMRERLTITKHHGSNIYLSNKKYVNFCSNDYLGISHDIKVQEAIITAAKLGLGSGASPLVNGYHTAHKELEIQFANFLNRDSAILYGSGYLANIGVITAFANKNSTILLDRLCHTSLIDATLLTNANYHRYPHNDIKYLEKYLSQNTNKEDIHIITEGIFGMEGNMANIVELVKLTKGLINIIIDDTHGIGIFGKNKGGICDQFHLQQAEVPILIASLAMAFGSYGAIVAGSKETIEILKQFSKTYIYATALPPIIADVTSKILKMIQSESWRHEKLQENLTYLNNELNKANINSISADEVPIKIILTKENSKCLEIQKHLKENGILVAAIRPPTVPPGTARIKLTMNVTHTKNDIKKLIEILHKHL